MSLELVIGWLASTVVYVIVLMYKLRGMRKRELAYSVRMTEEYAEIELLRAGLRGREEACLALENECARRERELDNRGRRRAASQHASVLAVDVAAGPDATAFREYFSRDVEATAAVRAQQTERAENARDVLIREYLDAMTAPWPTQNDTATSAYFSRVAADAQTRINQAYLGVPAPEDAPSAGVDTGSFVTTPADRTGRRTLTIPPRIHGTAELIARLTKHEKQVRALAMPTAPPATEKTLRGVHRRSVPAALDFGDTEVVDGVDVQSGNVPASVERETEDGTDV